MYRAIREFEFAGAPELLLGVVYDVARYPEFVRGVQQVRVFEDSGDVAFAEFTARVAGLDFAYVVKVERLPDEVRWRRTSGAFRDGGGLVRHLGGERFLYENGLDPGFAIPGFAVRFVLERSLPRLIRDFTERARQLLEAAPRAAAGTSGTSTPGS